MSRVAKPIPNLSTVLIFSDVDVDVDIDADPKNVDVNADLVV